MSREYPPVPGEARKFEAPITPEQGAAVSGEINPYKKEENTSREQELTGKIQALKAERGDNDKEYLVALNKIKEVETSTSKYESDLEVLNVYKKAVDIYKERNKSLDLQIDNLKDQLDKLK